MRIVTIEDIKDVYIKAGQRGTDFILSKFTLAEDKRTKSSFNDLHIESSNWWIIPRVRERWNHLITGDGKVTYEAYISEKYNDGRPVKMLSIGSGVCSHELKLAQLNPNWEITCLDFSEKLLQSAEKTADEEALTNIDFLVKDIYKYNFPSEHYDMILFHSSLHHFKDMTSLVQKVHKALVPGGKLIINEYVGPNRLQYGREQLKAINECLNLIDRDYKKIYKANLHKNKYYGSGILRMIISDPSECVESEKILPTVHRYFETVEERGFGGNLLMAALKDISHHFVEPDERKEICLRKIFDCEDEYLKHHQSDFVFGIYEKQN